MAHRFWPGQDPLGKRMKWGVPDSTQPWMTVVGVVEDVKNGPLNAETIPQTYVPYLQVADEDLEENITGMFRQLSLMVRTAGDPETQAGALRNEIRRLDSALPITHLQTMEQLIRNSVAPQRFNSFLLAVFAVVALSLAALGISGVLAYSVSQRTHEIGVRMALGAERGDVLRLVLRQGLLMAGSGILIGLLAAIALTRVLSSLLYGISPRDPWTFIGVPAVLFLVALTATWIPARRASRVDPMVALRYE